MPETLTNLGPFGLGIGLCVQPSRMVPLQANAAFLFTKLIQLLASMLKEVDSEVMLLGLPQILTTGVLSRCVASGTQL